MTEAKQKSQFPKTVGFAIGQKRHPSAIAVVEMEKRQNEKRPVAKKSLPGLQRLPLGSTYQEFTGTVGEIFHRVVQRDRNAKAYPGFERGITSSHQRPVHRLPQRRRHC